ncbi:hypothetical protein LTR84_009199 [Exophiala bonariae]|uniref:Peptidase metallopeptidase domain-containing protein n=1 Tax=Exophiala bonariae TaxID=1690606 RepID=A0AAV9MVY3_9EURO|nr:hypothetical protein LTR84_009199 [Exophiala bonariae]
MNKAQKPLLFSTTGNKDEARENTTEKVLAYLKYFGYVGKDSELGSGEFKEGLTEYQKDADIPATGEFDLATADDMNKPCCGIPNGRAIAAFEAGATKWSYFTLSYRFDNFCEEVSEADCRRVITAAFAKWSAVTPLLFREIYGPGAVDIRIGWYRRDHPPCNSFDGTGGLVNGEFTNVLAHAWPPPPIGSDLAGDVHFDEDENWSISLLENVALHEIGHAIGLKHSTVKTAVMYYRANGQSNLQPDDIEGIQSIYSPFHPVIAEGDPGRGIGDYDLRSAADRAFPFDYTGSGKADHLCFYRPGTGTFWILRNNFNGTFTAVYAQGDPGNGIGGYDLKSPADRAFAFDFDHSGRLDHIALYRPGTGTFWILKNENGNFRAVYAQGDPGRGIGGYDLRSTTDRAFAFDYDHSGKLDHVALYRPGTGTFWILKHEADHNFRAVYQQGDPGLGIGGYDLKSPRDLAFAFDYEHSGKLDHITLYRPGTGTFWILQHKSDHSFAPVYSQGDPGQGVAGYDLKSAADQAIAFDKDKLILYRPGKGAFFLLKNDAGTFKSQYAVGDPGPGVAGYDLRSSADQAFSFDFNSSGSADHLVFIRPGTGTIWIFRKL